MADMSVAVEILGNASSLVGAAGQSEQALDRLAGSATRTGQGLQTAMGVAAVAGITALGAGLVGAVSSAAGFEKQMSAVGAVAGATAEQMKSLTATALQLGKDTSFSASEAATGIEELIKAGVSIEDALGGGARAALDLAAAGAISVGEAAEIASNAMNVFGLKGADMAHVADTIAGAANASAISVSDYKFSLAAAGAVAATVGISFEDLSTAIAVMGQAGIKGSDAGTSLKTMLLNLQPSTKAQTAEFKRLGIVMADGSNAFFDATGKAKSMAEIAQVLQKAMAGMTKQQQLASLEILFGSDAIRAGAVLLKAGAAGFDEMAAAMGKVTAQSVANERLNNLMGSIEKLKGSLETGAIILGGMFTPALKQLADVLTDQVNAGIGILEQIPDVIGTIQSVLANDWSPDESIHPFTNAVGLLAITFRDQLLPSIMPVVTLVTDQLIPGFMAIVAPLGAGVVAFLGVVAVAGVVTAALSGIAAVLGLLLSPLGLVALAAASLAAAWTVNFGGIQQKTLTFVGIVQQALSGDIAGAFSGLIDLVKTTGAEIGAQLLSWGQQFMTWIGPIIPPLLAAAADLVSRLLDWVGAQAPVWADALVAWGTEWWNWLVAATPLVLAAAAAFARPLVAWVAAQIPVWTAKLLEWGQEFVAWVAPMIPPLLIEAGKLATSLLAWIGDQIPGIVAQLLTWGQEFVAWVAPQIPPLLSALGDLWLQTNKWIIDQVPGITAALVKWGLLFGLWVVTTAVPELLKALPGIIVEIAKWAVRAEIEIAGLAVRFGLAIVQGIWQGFQQAWGSISMQIRNAVGSLSLSIPIRTTVNTIPSMQARASGGPVSAGQPYIVGDGGRPELFVPGADGWIMPSVPKSMSLNGIAAQSASRSDGSGSSQNGGVIDYDRLASAIVRSLPPSQVNHISGVGSSEVAATLEERARVRDMLQGGRY